MSGNVPQIRENFGSKFGIIAAAAGSAVGLGNVWKFPYEAGNNGGGAFLVVYLAFIFLIGVSVMVSELVIGRSGQRNAIGSFKSLAPGKPWFLVGLMGIAAAFMIFAFYGAVAGWTLEYIFQSLRNGFAGKSPEEINQMYQDFTTHPGRPIMWQIIFLALTAGVVISGVKNGIEKYSKILMPMLVVIIVVLIIRSVTLPGAGEGLSFLFKPDFSKVTGHTVLSALGQAFFSLSLGMGTMITYGSYIGKKDNLLNTAVQVSLADTLIAVLAGMAIFPAVFAFNINPSEGPGLVFITLPNIFQQMPGGYIFSILFFVLLAIAALTSTISLMEVIVAYFSEELRISRKKATILAALGILILGILCSLSKGPIAGAKLFGLNFWDLLDYASTKIMLPLGGLLIVVFVGFILGRKKVTAELSNEGTLKARLIPVILFLVRFIAPIAIAMVFLNVIGILRFG